MDYLDELDDEAMAALHELHGEPDPRVTTSATTYPTIVQALVQHSKQEEKVITQVKRKSYTMDHLLQISRPITPAILASAAILSSQPVIVEGEGAHGVVQFCKIDALDVYNLKDWLAETYPTLSPFFLPINIARKALSPISAYPTLGYDTTLPHCRPERVTSGAFLPRQDQYPVWYFFYGTLADSEFLARLFSSPPGSTLLLVRAVIHGGKLRTWRQKYNALVDCPGAKVDGWAYEVQSEDQENILRVYETSAYEVVRVDITLNGADCVVQGCTFRFAGEERNLD
jgi:hypothetical protein